jgi:hypothetical protein
MIVNSSREEVNLPVVTADVKDGRWYAAEPGSIVFPVQAVT